MFNLLNELELITNILDLLCRAKLKAGKWMFIVQALLIIKHYNNWLLSFAFSNEYSENGVFFIYFGLIKSIVSYLTVLNRKWGCYKYSRSRNKMFSCFTWNISIWCYNCKRFFIQNLIGHDHFEFFFFRIKKKNQFFNCLRNNCNKLNKIKCLWTFSMRYSDWFW